MKIAKIKNSKDSELSLVIENDDDLIAWGNLRTEKAVNAMCYCCSKYLTTDNDDDKKGSESQKYMKNQINLLNLLSLT